MDSRVAHTEALGRSADALPSGSKPVDLLRVLRRRRTLIIVTVLLITGLTTLVALLAPPTYSATATLRVDEDDDPQVAPTDVAASIREEEARRQARISTLIEVIRSRALAQMVARDLALHDDPEFSPGNAGLWHGFKQFVGLESAPAAQQRPARRAKAQQLTAEQMKVPVDRLLQQINVAQDGQSNLINVTARSGTAAKAQRIANKFAAIYLQAQIDAKRASNHRKVMALEARVSELRDLLLKQAAAVEQFKRANRIDKGMGEDTGSVQMGRIASELAASRASRAEAFARTGSGGGKEGSSSLLTELRAQEATLERRSAELSTLYGSGHPDVRTVTAQLDQVRRDIARENGRISSALRGEATAQSARESQLMGDLGAMQSRSFSQNMASVKLGDLERDAETTRTLYVALLSRLKELRRQDTEFRADASVSTPALLPTEPSFPQPKKMIAASCAGSLMLALLLSVVAEVMDHRVRTSEHVKALVGLDTLGLVPELLRADDDLPPHLTIAAQPCSSFSETFRSVLVELIALRPPGQCYVVMVTSALPDEGKTTTVLSLGAAAATLGQRVAVLDFDMRKPGVSRLIDAPPAPGDIVSYLKGESTLDDILSPMDALPTLSVVRVAEVAEDPGALIASPRVPVLFAALRRQFDLVLVDTPPVLPVSDARSLASQVDDAVIVVRWSKTPPSALRVAVARFGGAFIGAIINRVDYAKHARLAYGDAIEHHNRYAGYYIEAEERPRWWPVPLRTRKTRRKASRRTEAAVPEGAEA